MLAHVSAGNGPIRFYKKRTDDPYGCYYLASAFPRRDFLAHFVEYINAVHRVEL